MAACCYARVATRFAIRSAELMMHSSRLPARARAQPWKPRELFAVNIISSNNMRWNTHAGHAIVSLLACTTTMFCMHTRIRYKT